MVSRRSYSFQKFSKPNQINSVDNPLVNNLFHFNIISTFNLKSLLYTIPSVITKIENMKQYRTICKLEANHFSKAEPIIKCRNIWQKIYLRRWRMSDFFGLMWTALLTEDCRIQMTQCKLRIPTRIPTLWSHCSDSLNPDFLKWNSWNELFSRWNDVRYFVHFRLDL